MSVDDDLLKQNQEIDDEEENDSFEEDDQEVESEPEPQSLREAVIMARAKKNEIEVKKSGLLEKENPVKKFSAKLLRSSWMNLLPTFGFSILGVLANVILRAIFGDKFFHRLGDEWTDIALSTNNSDKKIKMINILEPMGLALVLGLLTLFILSVLSLIAMIVGFIKEPLTALKSILSSVFERWRD